MRLDGCNQQNGRRDAKSVYGANRPQKKTAVYKFPGFASGENDLAAPAGEAVKEKSPQNLIECHVRFAPPFFVS